MDVDDLAGHWGRVLSDVDGGFGFFAEVAAHSLSPVVVLFDSILRKPLRGFGRVGSLPCVDRSDHAAFVGYGAFNQRGNFEPMLRKSIVICGRFCSSLSWTTLPFRDQVSRFDAW